MADVGVLMVRTELIKRDGTRVQNAGTSAITASIIKLGDGQGDVQIDWDGANQEELIAIVKEILKSLYINIPGVSENAIEGFLIESGMMQPGDQTAHLSYHKEEKK